MKAIAVGYAAEAAGMASEYEGYSLGSMRSKAAGHLGRI